MQIMGGNAEHSHHSQHSIDEKFNKAGAKGKFGMIGKMLDHKMEEHRGAGIAAFAKKTGHKVEESCCPVCDAKGDFLEPLNNIVTNCVDICEFPHRCWNPEDGSSFIMWKTLNDLQMHAEFHCPKFGCDICLREEF